MQERRKFVRLDTRVKVEYNVIEAAESKLNSVTKNLSQGGICLFLDSFINKDTLLALKLSLPEELEPLQATGKIVWIDRFKLGGKDAQEQYEAGVEFVEIANEDSRLYPRNPYGVAKVFGHYIVQNYRDSYGLFACASICFNHESERRGIQFVTRKISDGVARISLGLQKHISLGNLEPRRDWSYAPDIVEGIWRILQLEKPEDFVFATGESHSVEDFVREAFKVVGIDNWKDYIVEDPRFMRLVEVDYLKGDASKAKKILGWEPTVKFKEIIKRMVINDINILGGKK